VAWELDNTRYYSMVSLFYLGRLKELSDQLPETLKEAEDRGDLFHATNIRTRLSYFLRLASDQPQQAREELERAIESWSHGGYFVQHWYEMLGQVECALYAGNAVKAWSYLDSHWRNLKDSLLLRIQIILINSFYLRSRCAIAAAGEGEARTDPQRLLKTAEKSARRIESERVPWGDALALLLRAGIASSRGETQAAISLFGSAADDLKAVDMSLHAAAARRRRGELLGADEGRKLVETADEWMAGQGIGNPGRLSAMLAPGNSRRPEAGV